MWSKQLVTDLKCALLNLKSGDATICHMVAEDRGGSQAEETLGQVGKWADITENSVDEYGATYGCQGCVANGVTSTEACRARLEERLMNAPEHADKVKVSDERDGACTASQGLATSPT